MKSKFFQLVAILSLTALCAACSGPSALERMASPTLMYGEAERAMRIGSYDQAIAILEQLGILHPFTDEARQAKLDLIYAYYKANAPEQAIDAADNFIIENPRDPNVDYAYYLRGLVYFDVDRSWMEKLFRVDLSARPPANAQRAFAYFQLFTQKYPDSPYTEDARQRMSFLRNMLADYEMHVARYYMTRGAYVGAAQRARFVVENYEDAPAMVDALELLADAYLVLGLDDLAVDSERVLASTYGPGAIQDSRRRGLFQRIFRRDAPQQPPTAGTPSASE